MTYSEAKDLLESYGQGHLLKYYDELPAYRQKELLDDIEKIDFGILNNIRTAQQRKTGKITPIDAVSLEETEKRKPEFEKAGLDLLKEGRIGAVLLAGGQGSRLGFSLPKGMFDMGETRRLTIFELQMRNIFDVVKKTGRPFPLFIMTSATTDCETKKFFEENNYFGYPRDSVFFFVQDVAPACDKDGKIYLDGKHKVALAPNGNGGWYTSLVNSGLQQIIKRDGIRWLNVYGVDNVLQRICDPVFIGATVLSKCDCGAKVVKKTCPEEKVGVLCNEDGMPAVIEYYELPDCVKNERGEKGLVYCYGVTLNYLFNVQKLDATLSGKLPYHVASKAIPHIDENGVRVTPDKPCGYKFETLAVDIVKMMGSCLAFEVDRKKEFAPVKNATGVDSVVSARALLKENGVTL